jgi:hypothetical protein
MTDGMLWIEGSRFLMGSDSAYPEEGPVREVEVGGFFIDPYTVTNRDWNRFVQDTGYVTLAERPPEPADYPDADPALLVPGSSVFVQPRRPVSLDDAYQWWAYVPGADWRHPRGPETSAKKLSKHPVVHVAYEDAAAYASWAGKDLPTEGMGVRGAWRPRRRRVFLGRRAEPRRAADGEHLAGRVPGSQRAARRVRVDGAGGVIPTQRLRALRDDRERVGVDRG